MGSREVKLEVQGGELKIHGATLEFQGDTSTGTKFNNSCGNASVGDNLRPHPVRWMLYLRHGFESSNHKRGLFHHRFPTNNLKALSFKESYAPSSISVW